MESLLKEVYSIFRLYPDVFPHIRQDYVARALDEGRAVLYIPHMGAAVEGVLIYKQYKVKTKHASKGDLQVCQIAVQNPGEGIGTILMRNLFDMFPDMPHAIVTVRASNVHAIHFYEKHKFKREAEISWKHGAIPGYVYGMRRSKSQEEAAP